MSVQAVAAPALARLPAGWRLLVATSTQIDLDGFVVLVTPPGTPWLPNAIVRGPGPEPDSGNGVVNAARALSAAEGAYSPPCPRGAVPRFSPSLHGFVWRAGVR